MPSPLDSILEAVKRNVERASGSKTGGSGGGLLSQLGEILGGRKAARSSRDVRPASEDPYGDPADQPGGIPNVKPASQDPYGDPADQAGATASNVKPASEDPYGDPADQERRRG